MYALILEGGGARGAYHVGAYKAIRELNMPIGLVAGTSVGAINGAIFAQGDLDLAEALWQKINMQTLFDIEKNPIENLWHEGFSKEALGKVYEKIGLIFNQGGLDTGPLKKLLSESINEEKLRKASVDFALVTIDLEAKKGLEMYLADIPKGKLIDYIMASASLPVFKTEVIDGKKFLDGGFYNNLPVNLAISKNYDKIIVIRTYALGRTKKMETGDVEIITVAPQENLGKTLDFEPEIAKHHILMGYYDAMRAFKKLSGSTYYIEHVKNEHYYINYIANIEDDLIQKVAAKMNMEEYAGKRYLFEVLMPRVASLMDLPKNAGYKDLVIGLYETLALSLNLEKFKIYSYDGFLFEIYAKYKRNKKPRKEIHGIYMKNELLSKLKRQEILLEIAEILLIG